MTRITLAVPNAEERRLLEQAAKAAGIHADLKWSQHGFQKSSDQRPWNPLDDDGDALRLALASRIKLSIHEGLFLVSSGTYSRVDNLSHDGTVLRRAIVQAAAEVGRAMA